MMNRKQLAQQIASKFSFVKRAVKKTIPCARTIPTIIPIINIFLSSLVDVLNRKDNPALVLFSFSILAVAAVGVGDGVAEKDILFLGVDVVDGVFVHCF